MYVAKDDKHLYAFLRNAFNIMGKETSRKYLMGDDSRLYFSTVNIKGMIDIMRKEKIKGKLQDVSKHNYEKYFFTLKMLDDKSFELKAIEDNENVRSDITSAFKVEMIPVCDIDEECENVLSKIAIKSGYEVPDRYINQLKRLGTCKVYKSHGDSQNIVCAKNEYFSKENEAVETVMIFDCETW